MRAVHQSAKSSRTKRSPPIEPALGWPHLSREALARAKALMDEESIGVRDEISVTPTASFRAHRCCHGDSLVARKVNRATIGANAQPCLILRN